MTGPRVQIPAGQGPEAVRPASEPVETFERVGRGNGLTDLASALGAVSPKVASISQLLQQRVDQKDFKRGKEFARELQAQGKMFRDAIRSSAITADRSPFFRLGVKEQFGRITADEYQTRLTRRALEDLSDSTDPKAFDALAGEVRNEILDEIGEGVDEAFLNGFNPRAEQHLLNAKLAYNSQSGGRLIKQAQEQLFTEARTAITNGFENDLPLPEIADGIQLTLERAIATGLTGRAAIDRVVSAVSDVVLTMANDPSIAGVDAIGVFALLDMVNARGGPLSEIGRVRQQIRNITTTANGIIARRDLLDEAKRRREKAAKIEEVRGELFDAKIADPSADILPLLKQLRSLGATNEIEGALRFEQRLQDEDRESNFGLTDSLIDQLAVPLGEPGHLDLPRLMQVFSGGDLAREDLVTIQTQLALRDKLASGAGRPAGQIQEPMSMLRDHRSAMNRRLGEARSMLGFGTEQDEERRLRAKAQLGKRFYNIMEQHPDLSSADLNKFLLTQVQDIIAEVTEGADPLFAQLTSEFVVPAPHLGTVSRLDWDSVPLLTSEQYFNIADPIRLRLEEGVSEGDALREMFTSSDPAIVELELILEFIGVKNLADFVLFLKSQDQFHRSPITNN